METSQQSNLKQHIKKAQEHCQKTIRWRIWLTGRKTDETGRSLTIRRYVTWRLKSVLIGRIRIQRTLTYHNIRIMN